MIFKLTLLASWPSRSVESWGGNPVYQLFLALDFDRERIVVIRKPDGKVNISTFLAFRLFLYNL